MSKNRIQIGVISAAHGIRGEVKIRSFTNNPDDLFTYSPITDASGARLFAITRTGGDGPIFIASVQGISDRNAAELLKNTGLYAEAALLPEKTDDNHWYYGELTGLEARLTDGAAYGRIIGVYNFGAGDILDIEKPNKTMEMLPFTENFVGDVHADEGYVVVFPPDYVEKP